MMRHNRMEECWKWMVEFATRRGVVVMVDTLSREGGGWRVGAKRYVIINKVIPMKRRIAILKNALDVQWEEEYVPPVVREVLISFKMEGESYA